MNIKQGPSYFMENETREQIPDNSSRTDPSVPSLGDSVNFINFDDVGTSFMSNFISEREPVLRLVYLVVLSIATGFGNLLVLVAVLKFPSLRRPTNSMLGSLALSDFLVGTVTVPLYTAWNTRPGIFDRSAFMCALVLLSCLMVVTASQVSLLLLSVEQFLAVCHPFRHRSILIGCPRLHSLGIVFAWASSFLTAAVSLLAYEKTPNMPCNYYSVFDETFLFVASIFGVFFPFALIIYFNVRVLCVVKENEKKMSFAYRRDDNCPILRKKGRAERGSFSFSSSKTDGSSYDPSHRLSNVKGTDGTIEVYNYSVRGDIPSVYDSTQRKMSRTKTSLRGKYARMSTPTKESEIDIEITTNACVPSPDECRADVPLDVDAGSSNDIQDQSLQLVVESGIETTENADKIVPKSIQSLLVCDGSVLLKENKARNVTTVYDLARDKNQTKTWNEQEGETLARRWSLPVDKLDTHLNVFTPSLKFEVLPRNLNHTRSALIGDNVFSLWTTRGRNTNRVIDSNITDIHTNNTQANKKSFTLGNVFSSAHEHKFMEENLSLHDLSTGQKHKLETVRRPLFQLQNARDILKAKSFTTPLMSLPNVELFSKLPLDCEIGEINSNSLLQDQSSSCENNNLQSHSLLNLPKIADLRDNKNYVYVAGMDGGPSCKYFGQNGSKPIERTDTIYSSSISNAKTTVGVSEKIVSNANRDTIEGIGTHCWSHSNSSMPKIELDKDTNEEITVFIDPNDAEISIDSGISINISPENPDIDEVTKDLEDTEFIQLGKKTSYDSNKLERNGCGTKQKSSGCLPLVSATESLKGFRLKRRLRSLSFSSVGVSQKVRWMVALVCATFILAWFPFFAVILVNMFCDSCTLTYFLNAAIMVAFSKSMANPIVYALCHVEFRRAYAKVFKAIGLKSCC